MKSKTRDSRLIILLAITFFLTNTLSIVRDMGLDHDFYHLAASGRWMICNKAIEYTNESFVLDGYKTIIQQWMYCILLYYASKFGTIGVFVFTYTQFIILYFVSYKLCRVLCVKPALAAAISSVSMCFVGYLNCRPEIFSLILFIIQFISVERFRQTGSQRYLYILPVLTMLQVNFHGMFYPLNFVFLLPYIVPIDKILFHKSGIRDNNLPVKPFIIPVCLMIISLFINPYGFEMIALPFYALSMPDIGIPELQVTSINNVLLYTLVPVALALIAYKKKQFTSTTFYFTVGITLMSLFMIRNVLFLPIAVIYLLCGINFSAHKWKFYVNAINNTLICCALLLLFICISELLIGSAKPLDGYLYNSGTQNEERFIRDVAAYIKEDKISASDNVKIYTDFNSGSYFLYENVGKVYMQSKTEPYLKGVNKKEDVLREYKLLNTNADDEFIEQFLLKYDFDYICVDTTRFSSNFQMYLELSDSYNLVMQSSEDLTDDGYGKSMYYLYKKSK